MFIKKFRILCLSNEERFIQYKNWKITMTVIELRQFKKWRKRMT